MPVARGFANVMLRTLHYVRHSGDFGAVSAEDYESKAITFLNTPITPGCGIEENQRRVGGAFVEEWVRYNRITNEFAVVCPDGTICTYFKPMMLSHAPLGTPRDKTHKRSDNYQYFLDECNKR